jgi:glyoxylase-like metal-dependent hydrolase (beta-lactamase superfamily II)
VVTQDGVVLIDSGHNPTDSRAISAFVKKLTPLPVRLLIDTEPHPDHTTGHFVFSPPAIIVAHDGATESMKGRERETPDRIQKLAGTSPEMRTALEVIGSYRRKSSTGRRPSSTWASGRLSSCT